MEVIKTLIIKTDLSEKELDELLSKVILLLSSEGCNKVEIGPFIIGIR